VIAGAWPVCEVLHAYLHAMKRNAIEEYRNALLVWASLAPHQRKKSQPPKLPAILREEI